MPLAAAGGGAQYRGIQPGEPTVTSRTVLIVAAALALAACAQADNDMSAPQPSGGGSLGAEGPGYCDAPPSDMADMTSWEQMCQPQRN